jgi:endoglucanase
MSVRTAILAAIVALVVSGGGAAAILAVESEPGAPAAGADSRAVAASERFLDRYLHPSGAVVRTDQGSDVVSEGQAYAMLVTVATEDEERFRRVWEWTREHLQRPDGLLSWHYRAGAVADAEPAADADLDAARALVLAGRRFGDRALAAEGRRIARAVLARETIVSGGRRTLVAGPWARADRVVNPSYFSPRAYALLARATGDGSWNALARDARTVVGDLLSVAPSVAADWTELDRRGAPRPVTAPSSGDAPPAFGLDAQRIPLRFAESCDDEDRRLAASFWPFLRERRDDLRAAYDLRGRPLTRDVHAVTYVSAAAAAAAAGDPASRDELLDDAEAHDRAHPTYYGAAWLALGRLALTTDRLGCAGGARRTP